MGLLPSCGSGPRAMVTAIQHVQAIMVAIDQYTEKALGTATTFSTSPTASDSENGPSPGAERWGRQPRGFLPVWPWGLVPKA